MGLIRRLTDAVLSRRSAPTPGRVLERVRDGILRGRIEEIPLDEGRGLYRKAGGKTSQSEVAEKPAAAVQTAAAPLPLFTRVALVRSVGDIPAGTACELYEIQADGRYSLVVYDARHLTGLLPDISRVDVRRT